MTWIKKDNIIDKSKAAVSSAVIDKPPYYSDGQCYGNHSEKSTKDGDYRQTYFLEQGMENDSVQCVLFLL